MNYKKILSMVLALLMFAGVFSVLSVSATDDVIISELSATVTEPVAGEAPDYNSENASTDITLIQLSWWVKESETEYTCLDENDKFEAGRIYECDLDYVVNEEGISFADDVQGTVNGKEAEVYLKPGNVFATMIIYFECKEPVEEHHFDMENPISDTATCTQDGEVTYKCTDKDCDATKTEASAAKGHSFDDWNYTTDPDCVNDGEKERVCLACGETETETVPSYGGHTDDDENNVCDICGTLLDGFVNPDSSYDEATKDEATEDEATKDEATPDEDKPSTDDEQKPSSDDEEKPSDPVIDKGILGDVNGDGKVNIKDATQIQKSAAKLVTLTDDEKLRADVNADAKVNVKDATAIQKFVAKIETGFDIGKPIV